MKQKIKNKLKNKNTETIILAVFLVFMTLLFAYLVSLNGLLVWDEVVYLSNARGKISESAYTENFRFPLLSTIIAGLWLITGESILSAQILMIIISIATLGVFYAISCKFLSKGIALFSTIFLAINLQFITWGYRIYTDILGVFLFLSCLLLLIISQEEKNKSNIKKSSILLFFAGILSGLAFAARLSTIIPSIIFGIFFILYKSKNKWLKSSIIFSSGFIAAISYWIINGLIHHKNPLHFAFAQASAIIEYTAAQPAILMIQHILREYSISLLLIPFSIICFSKKEKIKQLQKKELTAMILILLFIQILFYVFFVNLKLSRYILEMAPFVSLLIFLGISQIIAKLKTKDKTIVAIFLIVIALISILPSTLSGLGILIKDSKCTSEGAIHQSIDFLRNKTEPKQTVVSSIWPYHAYYLNLEAYSPWSDEIDEYLKVYDLKYLITAETGGLQFQGNVSDSKLIKLESFSDNCGWNITIYEVAP